MAANKRRGEFEAEIGGKSYRFRLTMGALAEIEDANGGKPFAQPLFQAGVEGFRARQLVDLLEPIARAQYPSDADAILAGARDMNLIECMAMWTGMFKAAGLIVETTEEKGGERPLEPGI
jgi:hypothetical protein